MIIGILTLRKSTLEKHIFYLHLRYISPIDRYRMFQEDQSTVFRFIILNGFVYRTGTPVDVYENIVPHIIQHSQKRSQHFRFVMGDNQISVLVHCIFSLKNLQIVSSSYTYPSAFKRSNTWVPMTRSYSSSNFPSLYRR